MDDFSYHATCSICGASYVAVISGRKRKCFGEYKQGTLFDWKLDSDQERHLQSSSEYDANAKDPRDWLRQNSMPVRPPEETPPIRPLSGSIPTTLPMIGPGTLSLLADYGVLTRLDLLLNKVRLTSIPSVGHGKASILHAWARRTKTERESRYVDELRYYHSQERAEKLRVQYKAAIEKYEQEKASIQRSYRVKRYRENQRQAREFAAKVAESSAIAQKVSDENARVAVERMSRAYPPGRNARERQGLFRVYVQYDCPFCGAELESLASARGKFEPCPLCRKKFMVPNR